MSAASANSRFTAARRSAMSSATRSSRKVAGPSFCARASRRASKARSNRMGAVGGGHAGWYAAATLSGNRARHRASLDVMEADTAPTPVPRLGAARSARSAAHGRMRAKLALDIALPTCACPAASRSRATASAPNAGPNCRSSSRPTARGSAFPLSTIPAPTCCRWRRSPIRRPIRGRAPRCAMTMSRARWCMR